ncbi:MAG: helix-turn-helix domain-containing protein [Desulfurococcaceae archaeon]
MGRDRKRGQGCHKNQKEVSAMTDRERKVLKLRATGLSIRQIAQALGLPVSTVYRVLSKRKGKKGRKEKYSVDTLPAQIKEKLKTLLLQTSEEKGRKRTISLRRIYTLLELDLKMVGVNTLYGFYKLVESFVKEEWGSWEKLELARKGVKEAPKVSKGKIARDKGIVEMDATGYSFGGKNYSVMLALELYSMRVLGFYAIENKERQATHYNKAFSSLDVAKFMLSLFSEYGVPTGVKTDNERILTSEHITRSLSELGVEIRRTKPYSANQKAIERIIRELKDIARTIKGTSTIEELFSQVIDTYNRQEHRFEHFQKPVAPAEVELEGFKEVSEDALRRAFAERYERVVRNNTITIDNLKYEFYVPTDAEKELGRRKQADKVVCLRDIEDITKLEVYSTDGKYLGIARLISTELPSLEPVEYKQHKQREKRVERREKRLREELRELQEASVSPEEEEDILQAIISSPSESPKEEGEEWDILKIYGGET